MAHMVYSKSFPNVDFGHGHPLRGDRFTKFMEIAGETGFLERISILEPHVAEERDLLLAHTQKYLDKVETFARHSMPLSPDTPLTPELPDASRMIVGGALLAGDLALEHGMSLGFGGMHHAARDRGGGFCLYNDVAVLVQMLKKKGCKRILNLDTDAHCGDGTMDIFYEDQDVLYISTHQHPETLYPGRGYVNEIGSGEGEGYTINIPLQPGTGLEDYMTFMGEIIEPIAKEFQPDVVIRNGGSDPSRWDHLAMLKLDLDGLSYLGKASHSIALQSQVPYVDLAMSGYGSGIAEGWLALWRGVLGLEFDIPGPKAGVTKAEGRSSPGNRKTMEEAKTIFSHYWKL